jgi:tetratricopeptide (TPR) repeat protein
MQGTKLAGALAAVLLAGSAPAAFAQGQTPAGQEAARQALAQGLAAQYEVALIRERKLADDRETEQIGALEARLKAARAQANAVGAAARAQTASLESARAEYAQMAARVVQHDPTAQIDVDALRQQAASVAAKASPQMAAALQRFADGDRTGAWPDLQKLTEAEQGAADMSVADKARELRQLASLRDVMRAHGEATSADVLALYDASVELDPTSVKAQLARVRLARDVGDLPRARAAAAEALRVATTDNERGEAQRFVAEQAAAQHDYAAASAGYDQALTIFRRLAAADTSPSIQNRVAEVLQDQGDLKVLTGDLAGARAAYAEGLAIRARLAAAAPKDVALQDELASFHQRIGDLDEKTGDLAGAAAAYQQGLEIRRALAAADPTNADLAYYASAFLRRLGDLAVKQGDLATARKDYEACLAIRRRLSAANPSSAQLQNAVALDLEDLAGVAFDQNDAKTAREDYAACLAIRQKLGAADPTNAAMQQLILRAMARLARASGFQADWGQVAVQYRKIKAAGQLTPGDDKIYDALRAKGLAAGL